MRNSTMLTRVVLSAAILIPATGAVWLGLGLTARSTNAATLDPVSEGRRAFLKLNCYSCHGMHAAGGMGPNIQHAQVGDVSQAVRYGVPEAGMPPYGKYATNVTIKNLTAYLATAGSSREPIWVDWWNPIP